MAKKQQQRDPNLPTFEVVGAIGPVFLHWGNAAIKIADDGDGVEKFMEQMRRIEAELREEYPEMFS